MLRRRASPAGKIALETAYAAHPLPPQPDAAGDHDIPLVFASRHGECGRSVELLQALVAGSALSPTAFSLSVHNANVGLFSIARGMRGNGIAIAAGASTVEHALIEACGLLADGARQVLVVMADGPLPPVFGNFRDCDDEPFGWAWLVQGASQDGALPTLSLRWSGDDLPPAEPASRAPGGVEVLRLFLSAPDTAGLVRRANGRRWHWIRHA
ncbi:hypothetical protein PMI40_00720 [Herbaspirillum sp. YR522]|nr:hypothetical protein PMI40_00720 [Herbaspirillum sp. YR522]